MADDRSLASRQRRHESLIIQGRVALIIVFLVIVSAEVLSLVLGSHPIPAKQTVTSVVAVAAVTVLMTLTWMQQSWARLTLTGLVLVGFVMSLTKVVGSPAAAKSLIPLIQTAVDFFAFLILALLPGVKRLTYQR